MKSMVLWLFLIVFFTGNAQTKLPKVVDVHIEQFDQLVKYEDVSFSEALEKPDTVSNELTNCIYSLDFVKMECILFNEGEMIANVAILDVQPFENKIEVTLDDSAIETKIILDLNKKEFLYYYKLIYGYNITKPTKYTMVKF